MIAPEDELITIPQNPEPLKDSVASAIPQTEHIGTSFNSPQSWGQDMTKTTISVETLEESPLPESKKQNNLTFILICFALVLLGILVGLVAANFIPSGTFAPAQEEPTISPVITESTTPTPLYESTSSAGLVCPESGWVDCMPTIGETKNQCTVESIEWFKANCPDFQGVAQ